MNLNARILLYLSAAGASCALYRHGAIEEVLNLPGGEEGWETFNTLLLRHPGKPVAIAIDTVDEIYRQEALPRAHGADRHEMTARRSRQLIHHSPYRAALRQGPMAGSAHQDRYLIMGLTNPEMIRPWLEIAHLRGAHLAGIWLLPALSIPLVRQLRLGRDRLLLVSEQTGGLRLTYLEDGELRFSRLAPVDSSEYANPLESYAEEIERTRQALVGQRLLARAEPLRTVLLDPLNTLGELHAFLPEAAGFKCESLQRAQLLDALQLPPSLLAESSDALYLRLLPLAPAGANLMTPEQHAVTLTYWLRRGLLFTASAWLGLATLASAVLLLDAWRLDRVAAEYRQHAQTLRDRESRLLAHAGGADDLTQRLKTVQAWHTVSALGRDPAPAFQNVLATTAAIGNIRAHRLDWTANEPGTGATFVLEGEIVPFEGDFGAAHARIKALAGQLSQRLGTDVSVTQWPLDTAPDGSLEGEFGHSSMTARFRIETKEGS